jgi:membrane-associated protease RseP (regulator of RpoE activity)
MPDILPPVNSPLTQYPPAEVYVVRPIRDRYWLHVLLLLAAIFTSLVMGARMEFNYEHNLPPLYLNDDSLDVFPLSWALHHLAMGIPFSASLMLILLAHEMGHYLTCRYYGVSATLPFFVPFPSLIGTLGAFIRIRSPIRSRAELFDIGIAGPIAGFVVAVPVMIASLLLTKFVAAVPFSEVQLGYPLIFRLAFSALRSAGLIRTGTASGILHPMAIAAWAGMFATSLNLLPGGQLDGGHIVFSLSPRRHRIISRITILALIPMSFRWVGWLLWAVLLRITGMRHPIVDEWPAVTGFRRWIAVFGAVMLFLTFIPTPIANAGLMQALQGMKQLFAWHR